MGIRQALVLVCVQKKVGVVIRGPFNVISHDLVGLTKHNNYSSYSW